MANKKNPGKLLKMYKSYAIFEERSYGAKGVITKTNICVIGKKQKRLLQNCKNTAEAMDFIDTLKS